MDTASTKENWKTFGIWAFWVGVAFFSIYPICNWLTSNRSVTYALYHKAELSIPFIPEFFWVYISMYILFLLPPFLLNASQLKSLGKQLVLSTVLAGVIFLLLPSQLGFERISLDDALYGGLFAQLFTIDLPHNLVPSLHVIFSAIIALSISEGIDKPVLRLLLWVWLALLCLSTLLVHQHHLLDVITGLLIAYAFNRYFKKGQRHV
jgi:membrane-associated phospholipid phosphatase